MKCIIMDISTAVFTVGPNLVPQNSENSYLIYIADQPWKLQNVYHTKGAMLWTERKNKSSKPLCIKGVKYDTMSGLVMVTSNG